MTEEEKKVIESVKRKITIGKCEKNIGIPVYISELETLLNLIQKQDTEINKLNNVIDSYKEECQSFRAFCRRVRRDDKHNVDDFNYGREYSYIQFLNLLDGNENWSYEGEHFVRADKELEEIENKNN